MFTQENLKLRMQNCNYTTVSLIYLQKIHRRLENYVPECQQQLVGVWVTPPHPSLFFCVFYVFYNVRIYSNNQEKIKNKVREESEPVEVHS